jgi:uncharacterized protein with HEPN domain
MKKDDSIYLRHILDAISTMEEYLRGVSETKFKATSLLQDGAIRQIEIIGEAVRHISHEEPPKYTEREILSFNALLSKNLNSLGRNSIGNEQVIMIARLA